MTSLLLLITKLCADGKDSTDIFIKDDSKCLQFLIGSDFRLSSFQGSTISFKKHLSNTRAFRFGVTISGNIEDRNDFYDYENDTLDYRQIKDINNFGINIIGQYLKYIPYKHSHLYYGCGPRIIFSKTTIKSQTQVYTTGDWEASSTAGKSYSKNFQIGLIFVAGIEVFISKSISIHSEYNQGISYRYYWYKQYINDNTDLIRKNNSYFFDKSGVKFGCSFYF